MYASLKKYPNIKLAEDKDTVETAQSEAPNKISLKELQQIAKVTTVSEMYDLVRPRDPND
jgi:hypothetical protein